jgi:hypothetical protein
VAWGGLDVRRMGLYHAAIVIGYAKIAPVWDKLYRPLRQLSTFILVSLGWILFIFDFEGVANFAKILAGMGSGTLEATGVEPIFRLDYHLFF